MSISPQAPFAFVDKPFDRPEWHARLGRLAGSGRMSRLRYSGQAGLPAAVAAVVVGGRARRRGLDGVTARVDSPRDDEPQSIPRRVYRFCQHNGVERVGPFLDPVRVCGEERTAETSRTRARRRSAGRLHCRLRLH